MTQLKKKTAKNHANVRKHCLFRSNEISLSFPDHITDEQDSHLSEFLANFGHWTSLQQFASARKGPAMLLRLDVRSGSKADIRPRDQDVCFGPIGDITHRHDS